MGIKRRREEEESRESGSEIVRVGANKNCPNVKDIFRETIFEYSKVNMDNIYKTATVFKTMTVLGQLSLSACHKRLHS